jgi:hypothetical protein
LRTDGRHFRLPRTCIRVGGAFLIRTSASAVSAAAAHAARRPDAALLVAQHSRAVHVLCAPHLQDWKNREGVSRAVYRAEINHALQETNLQITQSGREIHAV